MNGRLEPWSTAPMVSMARLSSSQLSANLDQSCRKAVWMTASVAAAPLRRLSRSSRSPRCAWAPAASSDLRPHPTRQSEYLVARADEFFHDGGTDESGSAGNKYTHMCLPDLIRARIDERMRPRLKRRQPPNE